MKDTLPNQITISINTFLNESFLSAFEEKGDRTHYDECKKSSKYKSIEVFKESGAKPVMVDLLCPVKKFSKRYMVTYERGLFKGLSIDEVPANNLIEPKESALELIDVVKTYTPIVVFYIKDVELIYPYSIDIWDSNNPKVTLISKSTVSTAPYTNGNIIVFGGESILNKFLID